MWGGLKALTVSNCGLSGKLPSDVLGCGALASLDLSGNGLEGPMPPELLELTALTSLNLSENAFSGPLPSLSALRLLRSLKLYSNEFSGPLPDLGLLPSLHSADLSFCRFAGPLRLPAPSPQGPSNLRHLNVSYNILSGPPSAPPQSLSNLIILDVSNNDLDLRRFPWSTAQSSPTLRLLDVRGNRYPLSVDPNPGACKVPRRKKKDGQRVMSFTTGRGEKASDVNASQLKRQTSVLVLNDDVDWQCRDELR